MEHDRPGPGDGRVATIPTVAGSAASPVALPAFGWTRGFENRLCLACSALFLALFGSSAVAQAPLFTLSDGESVVAVSAIDVAEIDISELGGLTDVFVTLMPGAADRLVGAPFAPGQPLGVEFCGLALSTPPLRPPLTGHVYIAETSLIRAEALRAVWQGRARCDTLRPEVFEHGQ